MKHFVYTCLLLLSLSAHGKKVKFSVDMTDVTIEGSGVHITGDFQVVAGLAADSFNTLTPLEREGSTDIYSLVVDIPAFHKYEYKFVNGDLFYDTEFVPTESRIGYNFNDNRWIYVDSLANDTTEIGAVLYSGNAPSGQKLVRFLVDARDLNVADQGVYVATTELGLAKLTALYSFVEDVYEGIVYLSTSSFQYRYLNGPSVANAEEIEGTCANQFGNRDLTFSVDTVLGTLCYAKCLSCDDVTGVQDNWLQSQTKVYPNPSNGEATIEVAAVNGFSVTVRDVAGQVHAEYTNMNKKSVSLSSGMYLVSIKDQQNNQYTSKLVVK